MDGFKNKDLSTMGGLVAHGMEFAHAMMLEHGELTPQFIGVDASGAVSIIVTPYRNEDDKAKACEVVAGLFREHGIIRYVHISEAWKLIVNPGDARIEPRKSDRKIEVVICAGADLAGEKKWMTQEVIREPDKPISFGAADLIEGAAATGRMLSLLEPDADFGGYLDGAVPLKS